MCQAKCLDLAAKQTLSVPFVFHLRNLLSAISLFFFHHSRGRALARISLARPLCSERRRSRKVRSIRIRSRYSKPPMERRRLIDEISAFPLCPPNQSLSRTPFSFLLNGWAGGKTKRRPVHRFDQFGVNLIGSIPISAPLV